MLGDSGRFVVAAHHESGDVLQEEQRYAPLIAELDEMRCFHSTFSEQHTVVRNDAHWMPV
ncbi:Uncharacterised protein [Mycobacteroides abscessus subsp. abscessus]|nr:Uncharacterised protein [Mycobacteroides abscessus subsp. abscessus]